METIALGKAIWGSPERAAFLLFDIYVFGQPLRPRNSAWSLEESLHRPLTEVNLMHKKMWQKVFYVSIQ